MPQLSRESSGISVGKSPQLDFLKRFPAWLATFGGASEDCSSQVSEPQKDLLSDLDPELLRGVPLDLTLGKCGSYWEIPENGMLNVDPKLYKLSIPSTRLDNFLSHDWHTSRWLKYFSLLVIFNSTPAAITTFVVSCTVGLIAGIVGFEKSGFILTLPGGVVFLVIFCFWQRIRRFLLRRPVMVFMDKLCIAQHDDGLKEAGILGLTAFLSVSQRLTILWSPRYFQRLWCTFEVATFMNHGKVKNIDIIPVGMSLLLILLALHMKLQTMCLHLSLHVQEWDVSESGFFDSLILTFVESLLMLPLILYIGISLMKEVDELPDQLNTFEVKKTKCFCCASKHKHPETGEKLLCDRQVVYRQLENWYGRDGQTQRDCLNSFDKHVREDLNNMVLKSIGGGWYIGYSLTLIYGAIMPSIALWIHEAFRGPDVDTPLVGQDRVRWIIRCVVRMLHQPVLAVLTMWLYMAVCKAGVIFTSGCSRIGTAMILLVPLLIAEFLFKMPVEFFMRITDDTSLIPLIPFAFSTALAVILWWMTTWTGEHDRVVSGKKPRLASGLSRAEMVAEARPKNFVAVMEEHGFERATSNTSSAMMPGQQASPGRQTSTDTISI